MLQRCCLQVLSDVFQSLKHMQNRRSSCGSGGLMVKMTLYISNAKLFLVGCWSEFALPVFYLLSYLFLT